MDGMYGQESKSAAEVERPIQKRVPPNLPSSFSHVRMDRVRPSLHWARETDGCERVSHTFNAPAGRTDIREPTDFYQIAANFAELVNLRACNVLRTPRRNYLVHNDNNSDNGSVDTRVGTILIPGIMIPNSFGHFYGVN